MPFAAVAIVIASGCGGAVPTAVDVPTPEHWSTSAQTQTVTVTTTFEAGRSGAVYTEGAMAEVLLVDSSGDDVAEATGMPGGVLTLDEVPDGRYVLKPALRPCDGNCGFLDGRRDGCRQPIVVADTVRVRVHFVIGKPCVIA